MPKRISDPKPCPFGRPAYILVGVDDEEERVYGMCIRDFSCDFDWGGWMDEEEDCPLSGKARKKWHMVSD